VGAASVAGPAPTPGLPARHRRFLLPGGLGSHNSPPRAQRRRYELALNAAFRLGPPGLAAPALPIPIGNSQRKSKSTPQAALWQRTLAPSGGWLTSDYWRWHTANS
jgi:hypothetical protein